MKKIQLKISKIIQFKRITIIYLLKIVKFKLVSKLEMIENHLNLKKRIFKLLQIAKKKKNNNKDN